MTMVMKVRPLVFLLCSVLLAASCGTRLSRDEILAQNTPSGGSAAQGASQASGQVGGTGSGVDAGTESAGQAGDATSAGGTTGAATAAGGAGTTGSGGSQAGSSAGASGATSGGASTAAKGATKAPIVIALVGSYSGAGAPTIVPSRDGVLVWQKMINAKGGINGHLVQVLVGDDGLNDARGVSLVRDFVENKGAIALVGWFGSDITPIAAYAKSKRIPVIGAASVVPEWNKNPMLFPPTASSGAARGAAEVLKTNGVKKVAILYCVESGTCTAVAQEDEAAFKAAGLQVVYKSQYSVVQPDYTAECLQMRNSGAEAVTPIGEAQANVRLAQSCSRQGYHPKWGPGGTGASRKIPEYEGSVGASISFPFFLKSGSPAIDEYYQAFQKYLPNRLGDDASGNQTIGWVSAKIFEKAAANVSDKPTKEDILNGLWAMKGETVGGLLPGGLARTFTRDQPTPDVSCVFLVGIKGGQWVAPQGMTPLCAG